MKQLSQLPDECTVDTLHARLSYKPTFVSNPETSQNLPKQPKRSTPMSFSLEVQQYFALEEISKKPFKQTVKRKTLIEHRTQPKQQVQVILKDDFKYCRKSLQLQNNSATQYKQETLEDRIHRYSIKSKQTQGSKIPSQLEQIREDQTEVDEEQEHYFQKQKSRYHYYLKKAKNVKNSIQFVQSVRRFGTLEMCLGLEDEGTMSLLQKLIDFIYMLNTKYSDQDNLYELIIFQGYKNLVFYWNFAQKMVNSKNEIQDLLKQNRIQNIYGVSEGLKGFSQAFSSEPITNFRYFLTNFFKFSIFEMCSGVKIILLSNISDQTDYTDTLKDVYQLYLEIIKRNPFYSHGQPLDNPLFVEKISELFEPYQKKK